MLLLLFLPGCANFHKKKKPGPTYAPPFTRYVASNVEWGSLQRVLLMPLDNLTPHPQATRQMQAALAAELQRTGRYEVIVAPADRFSTHVREVFASGRFDELELHKIARTYQTEGILYGQITHYQPYQPLRVGLSLMLIAPAQAVVIASADGLWDAREKSVEEQALNYYRKTLDFPESLRGKSRVLESPETFQRFVAYQISRGISNVPSPTGPRAVRQDEDDVARNDRASPKKPASKPSGNSPSPPETTPAPTAPRVVDPESLPAPGYSNRFGVRFAQPLPTVERPRLPQLAVLERPVKPPRRSPPAIARRLPPRTWPVPPVVPSEWQEPNPVRTVEFSTDIVEELESWPDDQLPIAEEETDNEEIATPEEAVDDEVQAIADEAELESEMESEDEYEPEYESFSEPPEPAEINLDPNAEPPEIEPESDESLFPIDDLLFLGPAVTDAEDTVYSELPTIEDDLPPIPNFSLEQLDSFAP